MKIYKPVSGRNFSTFTNQVELGEFQCAHNPTVSTRNPEYNPRDPEKTCNNVATHVEQIKREFVMGTYIYYLPLCDEHKDWYF